MAFEQIGRTQWHGGIVGIQILLNTRGENVETIEFGLFERTGRELGDLPFNYSPRRDAAPTLAIGTGII